jgi:hypothetical protein
LSLNLAPNELDTNDSDRLNGIKDRDFSFMFGVDADEQNNSVYSQYQVGSVLPLGVTLGGYYQINKQWNMVANLRWQSLPIDI